MFISKKNLLPIASLFLLPYSAFAYQPEHAALVDTGYDLCVLSGGTQCEQNKNLLVRGDLPQPDDPPYTFDFDGFRTAIFSYLTDFRKIFSMQAPLPNSVDDLKNYRIVDIDLIYDFNEHGDTYEFNELESEFLHSGQTAALQLPEQHVMYGLTTPFDSSQYAFEWWPVTFAALPDTDPNFVTMNINWPSTMGTPPHSFLPQEYKLLDFPYLINGTALPGDRETSEAKDLVTLLKTIPSDGHPLLIYYHCIAGKDRTGAVSAAYFLQHGGYPYIANVDAQQPQYRRGPVKFADALKYTILPNRQPSDDSIHLGKAYCLSINGDCTL